VYNTKEQPWLKC